MNLKKRIAAFFIAILLICTLIISDYQRAYAVSVVGTLVTAGGIVLSVGGIVAAIESTDTYTTWHDEYWCKSDYRNNIKKTIKDIIIGVGLPNNFAEAYSDVASQDPIQAIRKGISEKYNKNENEVTDEEISQSVYNMFKNCRIGDDYVSLGTDLKDFIKWYGQYMLSLDEDKFLYSYDLAKGVMSFNNGIVFNGLKRLCQTYQDDYYIFSQYWGSYNIILIPKSALKGDWAFCYKEPNYSFGLYNKTDWLEFYTEGNRPNYTKIHAPSGYMSKNFYLDSELGWVENPNTWSESDYGGYAYINQMASETSGEAATQAVCGGASDLRTWRAKMITYGRHDQIFVYGSLNKMKQNVTGLPNYFVSNTWNNFVNNSGDTYTIDNSNCNNVTYGDVINYITNYPSPEGPSWDDIRKWIDDQKDKESDPTPTPTLSPTPGPDNPLIDPDDPTPTPTYNPDDPNDFDPWHYPTVSGNGTDDDTDGWSFWDFLKGIINFLKGIVEGIGSILSAITDWFTVDTDLIKTHVSGVIDGSVPLPNGVSYNGIVNEIIPVEDIKSIGKTFTDIPDGFVPGTYYPKLTIKTPQIIRQFYDEEEIVLLDFEEWASTFVIVRTLLEFSFWLAEIYYLLSKLRPVISIS